MKQHDVLKKLQDIIEPYLDKACEIRAESDLSKDLCINSVDFISIIIEVEEEFQCNITEEEMIKIRLVKDFVQYIIKHKI